MGSTRNQEKRKESSLAYCLFRSQNVPLIITGNDHTQTQLITAPIKWTVVQRETTRSHTESRITRISFFTGTVTQWWSRSTPTFTVPTLSNCHPYSLDEYLEQREPIHAHTWSCTHVWGPLATISRVGKNSPFKRLDPTSLRVKKFQFTRLENPLYHR